MHLREEDKENRSGPRGSGNKSGGGGFKREATIEVYERVEIIVKMVERGRQRKGMK